MGGQAKTLKQIDAAKSVVDDVMDLLDTYGRPADRKIEGQFLNAVMTIARIRVREIQSELSQAHLRAFTSPEHVTVVDKTTFDHISWFRAVGPTHLSNLLAGRRNRA
jgi:hypothetical protein